MGRPYRECSCHEDGEHRCTATSKQSGERCQQPAEDGCNVCKWHGSRSPWAQEKKQERLLERQARAVLEDLGEDVAPIRDPIAALQQIAGEIVKVKEIFREQVAQLREIESYDRQGVENVRAVVSVYERGLDRSVDVLSRLAKLGIEERAVKADEDAVRVLFLAVVGALEDPRVGLTAGQIETARELIAGTLEEGTPVNA